MKKDFRIKIEEISSEIEKLNSLAPPQYRYMPLIGFSLYEAKRVMNYREDGQEALFKQMKEQILLALPLDDDGHAHRIALEISAMIYDLTPNVLEPLLVCIRRSRTRPVAQVYFFYSMAKELFINELNHEIEFKSSSAFVSTHTMH